MRLLSFRSMFIGLAVALCFVVVLAFSANSGLTSGKADLKSAGALAFGPEGILFVGDSLGASIFAIDTEDTKTASASANLDVKGINEKIAGLLGTSADQIAINDVKVNPASKNIYMSVSRGKGPDAVPMILRVDGTGKITPLSLDNVKHSKVTLPDPPANQGSGRNNPRMDTITQVAYVNGNVLVSGLSNEEFSSNMRSITFPFQTAGKGANIEIYHGSHQRYETNSPIRTFVPYTIKDKQYILASYTCTPLVSIPVSELKPGNKVKGTTIAELGAGNRPLDMVTYRKDGHDWLLMANSSHGVLKLSAENLDSYKPILAPVERTAGIPATSISELKGVQHLVKFDDGNALILASAGQTMELRAIPLP
jgi:hypothetical protein